jgi:hypothetical protein
MTQSPPKGPTFGIMFLTHEIWEIEPISPQATLITLSKTPSSISPHYSVSIYLLEFLQTPIFRSSSKAVIFVSVFLYCIPHK